MLTYFDLVEGLIVSSYGGAQDAEQRDIRTAIHRAYDEVTTIRDWAYYHVHGRIITSAPETDTVAGVVSPTQFSLATGVASTGHTHVRVGDRIARIKSMTETSVTISGETPLSYDLISVGDKVTLYTTLYALPSDFRNLDEPSDEFSWWSGNYVTPDQAMKLERVSNTTGTPYHWTVIKNPKSDGWAIKLIGYPTEVETVDFTYRRTARPIRYSGHEPASRQGTIARTGTTVTGSGTAFTAAMVGSILRVGDTTNTPGPIESMTPWVSEAEITSRNSDTAVATVNNSGTIAAGTKYLITDPVDVAPHMQQVMDSACDYWLARIRGGKVENALQLYQRDLRLAMERDQLAPLSGRSSTVWHDGGWRSPLKADGGV